MSRRTTTPIYLSNHHLLHRTSSSIHPPTPGAQPSSPAHTHPTPHTTMAPIPTPAFILHLKGLLLSESMSAQVSDAGFALAFVALALALAYLLFAAPAAPAGSSTNKKTDAPTATATATATASPHKSKKQAPTPASKRAVQFASAFQNRRNSGGSASATAEVSAAMARYGALATPVDEAGTFIAMVIDRSGSMRSMGPEVAGSINAYLDTSRKDDAENGTHTTLLLSTFDAQYEKLHTSTPLDQVPPVVDADVAPRGSTALHDAIGFCLRDTALAICAMPARPSKVIVFILTDGHENASQSFSSGDVKECIAGFRDTHTWDFFFAAANQDAVTTGSRSLGLGYGDCITYSGDRSTMRAAFSSAGSATLRSKKRMSKAWTPEERSSCA